VPSAPGTTSFVHRWFHLTFIVSNIVSITIFEICDAKTGDLDLGRFKVIQGQRSRCQSIAHRWFPIRLQLTPSSYLSPFSKYAYLMCNFSDLELGQFKVIQVKVHTTNRKSLGGFLYDLLFGHTHTHTHTRPTSLPGLLWPVHITRVHGPSTRPVKP